MSSSAGGAGATGGAAVYLARQAGYLYALGRHDECVATLDELDALAGADDAHSSARTRAALAHNKAIVAFSMGVCDARETDDALAAVVGLLESDPQPLDADKQTRTVCTLNRAILAWRQGAFASCLAFLEPLSGALDTLPLHVAVVVALLTMTVTLGPLADAAAAAATLEQVTSVLAPRLGVTVPAKATLGKGDLAVDAADDDAASPELPVTRDSFLVWVYQWRARLAVLSGATPDLRADLVNMVVAQGGSDPSRTCASTLLVRAHALAVSGDTDRALHFLHKLEPHARDPTAAVCVAPPSAEPQATDTVTQTILANNTGVVHALAGRPVTAHQWFLRALDAHNPCPSDTDPAPDALEARMMYNTGLQLLLMGEPALAFAALSESLTVTSGAPHVWIRLAESCIALDMLHAQDIARGQLSDVAVARIGAGVSRRVLIASQRIVRARRAAHAADHPDSLAALAAGPTLHFADVCLANALFLLSLSSSQPQQRALTQAVMVKRAYVALALDDPNLALSMCERTLTEQTECPPTIAFLAHMYAAEALCALGRAPFALGHLSNSVAALDTTVLSLDDVYSCLPYSNSVAMDVVAHTAFHTNRAATQLMTGDVEAAAATLEALPAQTAPPVVVLRAIVALAQGAGQGEARDILVGGGVVFPPSTAPAAQSE